MDPAERDDVLEEALRRADLDDLVRLVDTYCAARAWDQLAVLKARCERAQETGRQLWPAVTHAAYRLALEAPAPHAAAVLVEGASRFTLGPLPEVAAQAHPWRELAPHVSEGAPAVLAAHERVVRGEDCSALPPAGPPVLDLPLRLAAWEPRYAVAEYHAHSADFPAPPLPRFESVALSPDPTRSEVLDEGGRGLLDLVKAWTTGSNGRAEAVVVAGTARHAIAALGPGNAGVARVAPADAVAVMAWAGASGGAHGRRPGAAAGRFAAWWAAAALTGLTDDWPPDPDRLGAAIAERQWFAWQADEPATGWRLHLAVEDPARGRAWAVAAVDAK